ncbi:IS200/IS605 family transposase [Candidatus Vondammii sp. HM_W22]|uniref:IS200/IS605 family transposase n=1 Tax=Candidatus Vondammii sp. HM_W22 TaxID=2687299 RepID=UPI001F13EC61|nr:IS200/IS605 family transposase [Candidatus Vondammii sp. HM_W22]
MKHRHGSHTKYHYRVLVGEVGLRVRELVRQTCEHFEIEILRGVVSNDHVHLLVSAPPSLSPSDIMKRVKGRSSTRFFQEFPRLKKRYWGQHFWARGYFCVTAGELTKQMIEEYLQHHFEKNFDDNFEVE